MSRGINRAKNAQHAIYESVNSSKYCVFISHKYEDLEAAREIAAYIQDSEIDVYLDDNDNGLQEAAENNDSEKIVRCIETALKSSTHILVLITENTRKSWWVPYETGYAKNGGKNIASLLLKNVDEFPDYLKIETMLTGYESLSEYIENIYKDMKSYTTFFESVLTDVSDMHKSKLLKYIRSY